MPGDWVPLRYDMSRELRLESPAHVGAIPVADHPVQPFGTIEKVTNLNQDLTMPNAAVALPGRSSKTNSTWTLAPATAGFHAASAALP